MRLFALLIALLSACGGNVTTGVETITAVDGQTLLAFAGGQLYGTADDGVWRLNPVPGAPRATIVPSNHPLFDLLTDAQNLFFTQGAGEASFATVRKAALDGTAASDVAPNAQRGSVRQDATYLYWFDRGTATAGLVRAPKSGGPMQKLADAGLTLVPEIAVDETSVYWLDSTQPPRLMRVAKSGGAPAVFLADASPSLLQNDGADLYFLDEQDGATHVFALSKATAERREIVREVNRFWLDGTFVYFSAYGKAKNPRQAFKRFDRASGKTDILLDSLGTLSLVQVTFDASAIYWADGHDVKKLNKPATP